MTNRILKLVKDLGNTVLAKRAAADLHGIKKKKPPAFQSTDVLNQVMKILESHHFRLQMRRFVIDLFDKSVMRRIVLEEEEEEADSDTSSEEGIEIGNGRDGDDDD